MEPVVAQVPTPVGHETNTEHPEVLSPPQETDAASPIHPLNEPATGDVSCVAFRGGN